MQWNLKTIPPNNERLSLVITKFLTKYYRILGLIFLPYNISIILKLKGFVKRHLISRIVKVDQNVYRTANFSASIHTCTNQILLSSNPLELSPWSVRHILKTIETMWWTCMWKVFRSFSTDNGRTSRWSIVNRISNHHPKISRWCSYRFRVNFTNIEVALGEKSSRERFWKNGSQCQEIPLQVK